MLTEGVDELYVFRVGLDQLNTSGKTITLYYELLGTATMGEDYNQTVHFVEIPAEFAGTSPNIILIDDAVLEEDETISPRLASGQPGNITLGLINQLTLTLKDND